ncbi:MAG: hypothetical protein E7635_00430 [Ruminococcaceae bacterium]|nr:hypothetical protein [Oscillospiraceae bacterium]
MKKAVENISILLAGGVMYAGIELLWRGYTHPSMVLTGGVCFLIIYRIAPFDSPLLLRVLACAAAITAIEFAVGVCVNIIFELNVWDYSDRPFNLLGQICPLYSFFWFILSFAAIPLCNYIYKWYRRLQKSQSEKEVIS